MQKARTLRAILLKRSIVPSITLISVFIAVSIFSLFFIRKIVITQAEILGRSASSVSGAALEKNMRERAQQTSLDIAALFDEKLLRMQNFSKMLSDSASNVYTYPENFKPRIIPQYKVGEIPQTLEPTLNFAPNVSPDRVRSEAQMVSNASDMIKEIINISSDITAGFIATQSGIIINIATTPSPAVSYDPSTRPWFSGARDNASKETGVYWSEIYIDVRGRGIGIACSAPIYKRSGGSDVFVGAAGCGALLANFSHIINNATYIEDNDGIIFLLDGNGVKVFSSDGTGIQIEDGKISNSENYLESSNADLRKLAMHMTQRESGVMTLAIGGEGGSSEWVDVAFNPLHTVNWSVGVIYNHNTITSMILPLQQQIEDYTKNMKGNTNNYIWMIAFGMLIIGTTVVLVRIYLVYKLADFTTAPISALVAEAEAISSGDLDAWAHVSTETKELEQLAVSFNNMKARLREYIDNLATATAEKERISTELVVATKIQTEMLTNKFPPYIDHPNDFDLFAAMHPAREVGGDFYDFFFADENHFALVIADVAGKGVPAALLMVVSKTLIKSQLLEGSSAKATIEKVNNELCENNIDALFVTVWIGLLNLKTKELEFINAGHNPPLLKSGNFGFRFLAQDTTDLVIGVEKNIKYQSSTITLKDNDILVLYTDGITEAFSTSGVMYGEERLKAFVSEHYEQNMKSLVTDLQSDVGNFTHGAEQSDDMTVLCLKMIKETILERRILKVKANIGSLDAVTAFVTQLLEMLNCPVKEKQKIELAVEELFVNIANYAYDGFDGDAEIITIGKQINNRIEVTVIISDCGKQFNPLLHDDPDISASLDDREIGGLGLLLVKKTMATIKYDCTEGRNQTTIIKSWEL